MRELKVEVLEGEITRLSLNSGSGNSITPGLVSDLSRAFVDLGAAPPRAVVLDAGASHIFSAGFDLPTVGALDREHLAVYFQGFLGVLDRMLRLPCPIIAAIDGHAIAGGFILSLACDYRIVGAGPKRLGLSEVDLGAAVPAGAQVLLSHRTSPQVAKRLSETGHLMGPEEALRVGYADELAEEAGPRALELAQSLAMKPGQGVGTTKLLLGLELAQRVAEADAAGLDAFLDTWFSPEAQSAIGAMVARLKRR